MGLIFNKIDSPPHYKECVRDAWNEKFEHRWIGRGSPIAWPLGSPCLASFDF